MPARAPRRWRTREARLALALVCAILAALAWDGPPARRAAAQAGGGAIEGQLVTRGGAAVGGTAVLLTIATGAPRAEERTTAAGDDGRFRFEDVTLDARAVYLLRVTYDGGNYFQEVTFDEGATVARAAPLDLYPATRDAEAVSFARLRMLFSAVDREGIGVVENGAFRNASDRAYIGPPGARDATSLRFGLPRGATQVQPAQGFNRDTLLELAGEEGPGFTTLEAIPPGERQFAYIYRLTPRDRALALDRVFHHRTELFQLYLPAGARLDGGGGLLRDGGETQLPDGQRYRLYTAQGLAPGTRLTARLTNLPSGDGETNQLLLVAAVFALMLGAATLLVYGRRRAASPATATTTRGLRTVPGGVTRPRERQPTDPGGGAATGENLGERRQRLLLELVELDEQYEAGALAEPEYRRRRAARKDELVGVLRQLEPRPAGGSEAAAGQRRGER